MICGPPYPYPHPYPPVPDPEVLCKYAQLAFEALRKLRKKLKDTGRKHRALLR